jgi:hypothetical protein
VQSPLQQSPLAPQALPSPRQEGDAPASPPGPPPAAPPVAVALPAKTSAERLASVAPKPTAPEDWPAAVASSTPPSAFAPRFPEAPPHAATITASAANAHALLFAMFDRPRAVASQGPYSRPRALPLGSFHGLARFGAGHSTDRWPAV